MTKQFNLDIFNSGDGAHWGLSDWYEEKAAALKAALESGLPFDTGWYGSKKEIASARISSDGTVIQIEVSVSDDFDTEGSGEKTIPAPATLEQVSKAIDEAWDSAEANQDDNRQYRGYALYHYSTKIPEWHRGENVYPREKRKRYPKKVPRCLDYFIVPAGDLDYSDHPPGDNYSFWGWQNDEDGEGANCVEEGIPESTVEQFTAFAKSLQPGVLRIGDWEIRSWDKEEEGGEQ
jgi:hypothetical protein